MKRTLLLCIVLFVCCFRGYALQRASYRISIDKAEITVNGKALALPTTVAELERFFGKHSRMVDKGGVPNIYVWDDVGLYCREYKFGASAAVHDLSIALGQSDIDLDFYPKHYFKGSLSVDKVAVTKDSTVASINSKRDGEKFVDQLYGMYWSVKYDRKSVGLGTNKQRIHEVSVSDGRISVVVKPN